MPRLLSRIKRQVIGVMGDTVKPRSIALGLNRGVRMTLDLASDTQTYLGVGERELASYFQSFSRDAVTAIDVGGSAGFYCLFFLKKTAVKRVYCFEPEAPSVEEILANVRLNGLADDSRLKVIQKFVGSKDDEQHVSLNSLADDLSTPCIVKVDVEGAELDVLEGASRLLSNRDVRWIVETHTAALEKDCLALFASAGRNARIVDKAWWRMIVPEMRPTPHNRWLVAG